MLPCRRYLFAATTFASLSASVACARLCQAQGTEPLRQPVTIPYPLAAALVAAGGLNGEPQILVGSLPEWIAPKMPTPRGAQVLGSAFVSNVLIAVFQFDKPPAEAGRLFEESFKTVGWITSPQSVDQLSNGGFQLAAQPPRSLFLLCNGSQSLTASVMSQMSGGSAVVVRHTQATGPTTMSCKTGQLPGTIRNPMPRLTMPSDVKDLRAPDCGPPMSFQAGNLSIAQMKKAGPLASQLESFAKQLVDSGWSPMVGEKSQLTRYWSKKDTAGVERRVELTIMREMGDTTCRQLLLRISDTPPQRP